MTNQFECSACGSIATQQLSAPDLLPCDKCGTFRTFIRSQPKKDELPPLTGYVASVVKHKYTDNPLDERQRFREDAWREGDPCPVCLAETTPTGGLVICKNCDLSVRELVTRKHSRGRLNGIRPVDLKRLDNPKPVHTSEWVLAPLFDKSKIDPEHLAAIEAEYNRGMARFMEPPSQHFPSIGWLYGRTMGQIVAHFEYLCETVQTTHFQEACQSTTTLRNALVKLQKLLSDLLR